MKIIRNRPARSGSGFRPQDSQHIWHFPWRYNLLRFWEAEPKDEWGAGGDGERRGGFGGVITQVLMRVWEPIHEPEYAMRK